MGCGTVRADLVAARVPGLRLLAVICLAVKVLGIMSDRDCSVRVAWFPEGTESMQGTAEVRHGPSGLAERRAVDRVVTQAEPIGAARQMEESVS